MNMKRTKWYSEFADKSILMGYRGSQAHGTWRPPTDPTSIDDIDIMAVIVHPKEAYLGFGRQETYERKETDPSTGILWDIVVYDLRHFVRLLVKQNPNVLSMLWLRPNDYAKITTAGQALIYNRGIFISKEAHKSFTGYAYSQLHKMTNNACEGYMGAKRKKLVEKFGFDVKNASHLIRLLKMNIEYLSTGQLNVMREDNTYLVDIKQGKYSLDEIKSESDRLFRLSEEALIRSSLPDRVDVEKAENLLVEILEKNLDLREAVL